MRPVQFLVAMFLVVVLVFSWRVSDAQGAAAPWRMQSGRGNAGMSHADSAQNLAQRGTGRIDHKLDSSRPSPKHGSSTLIPPSRTAILAVVCTGLGLAVTTAVVVSLRQPLANRKVPRRRIQHEFKARTWVELTQSPQF